MKSPSWAALPHPSHAPASTPRARPAAVPLRPGWLQHLVLVVAVVLLAIAGMTQLRTPDAAPATAPATEFSAARAMQHLEVVAAESRAIGMPGHDAVRDYLVAEMEAMGLAPELQTTTGIVRFEGADDVSAGTVTNVIARIPGTASTGAIALNAHYDSGATGPAASDNGSGVVAVLETVRAILASEPLQNDVLIVFTDGEEHGDIGAAAFTTQHAWADDVRLALNFEAQGSGGPVLLYATSEDNGWLTGRYFDVVPHPAAYSLVTELVMQLPGMRLACDLEDYLLNGSAGLGFVYVSDTTAYHTARDSIAAIDRGSLQQEGENTLATVRHFGGLDLTSMPTETNRVFFTVLPGVVLHYSGSLVVPLAALVTVALAALLITGVRRGHLSVRGILAGAGAFPLLVALGVAIASLLWMGMRQVDSTLQVILIGSYQTPLHIAALSLAAVAVVTAGYALLGGRVRTANLVAGAAIGWALGMWGLSLAAPGASYLATWPLLFGLLPLAWTILAPPSWNSGWARAGMLLVALVPIVFLLPGTWYQMVALLVRLDYFAAFGGALALLGLWALFVAPLVGLALPQLDALAGGEHRRWLVPTGTAIAAVALLGWGIATSGFDTEHPRPNHIAWELDATTGEARWISADQDLDAWTGQFFGGEAVRGEAEVDLGWTVPAWTAPAPAVPVTLPELDLTSDQVADGTRTVTVHVASPREAAEIALEIEAQGPIVAASINGLAVDLDGNAAAAAGSFAFGYAAPDAEGFDLTLVVEADAPIAIELRETAYGLPEIPGMTVTPRPADTMPATGLPLDATVVRLEASI